MVVTSPKIKEVLSSARKYSFEEKRLAYIDENKITTLVKSTIKAKIKEINNFNDELEKLTWIDDIDEGCLMLINDLISFSKDWYSSLIRQYVAMEGTLEAEGIAKEEIENFRTSIDELKESFEDLESVFFFLPKMPDFVETTKQLSLI